MGRNLTEENQDDHAGASAAADGGRRASARTRVPSAKNKEIGNALLVAGRNEAHIKHHRTVLKSQKGAKRQKVSFFSSTHRLCLAKLSHTVTYTSFIFYIDVHPRNYST